MNEEPTSEMMIEAILLSSGVSLTTEEIADRLPRRCDVRAALAQLATDYENRSLLLVETGGAWAIRTSPEHSDLCRKLLPRKLRLSRAAMETLAVIAYFQPVTRADIERVRGVSLAKGTLDLLIWAGLVRPGPRRRAPGNPMTFLTTDAFLAQFDIGRLSDLPGLDEMREAGLLSAAEANGLPEVPDGASEAG